MGGPLELAAADHASESGHGRADGEEVDAERNPPSVAGEDVGRDDHRGHDHPEDDHVAGEGQLGDHLADRDPGAHPE